MIEHRELTSRLCHISKKSGSKRIDLSNRSVHSAGTHLQNEIVQMQGCEGTVSEVTGMRSHDLCDQKRLALGASICFLNVVVKERGTTANFLILIFRRLHSSLAQTSLTVAVCIDFNES